MEAASALIADEPPPRDEVSLVRFATTRLGKDVIDLVDATVVLGDRAVLDRVTWRLAPGERIGIVGVNGSGKSTLLGALTGDVALRSGQRRVGKTVAVAYLSQEVRELERFATWRVIEAVEEVRQFTRLGDRDVSASQVAKRLGFSGGRQQAPVSDLSGGERRRLQLLRLLMGEPNVLILDEPTNDLDIETLTSLEDLLDGWAGTLLVASHDRYLLERVADRHVALLGDGRIRDLPGGVEQYLQLRQDGSVPGGPILRAAGAHGGGSPAAPGPGGTSSAIASREARRQMSRIERQLARLARQEDELHAQMVAKASDHAAVLRLNDSLRALVDEREELELQWLVAAETVG